MAMSVSIVNATGASPTWASVGESTAVWNRVDSLSGTTAIPTPSSTGTNFSFIKTFTLNITSTDSLSMSDVRVGKVASEETAGTLLWHTAEEEETDYVEATVAPTSTEDNNVTAPTLNGVTATELPLIAEAPAYAAGPFNTTGRIEPIIEIALGVDATNTEAGESVSTPTIRWSWTES